MLLWGIVTAVAFGQEPAFDGHGFVRTPGDGDLADPLVTWRPERQDPRSFGAGGLFEFADAPLVVVQRWPSGALSRTELVDDLVTLNLGAHGALGERVAVALAAPVHLAHAGPGGTYGPALGDWRLSVPLAFLLPAEDGDGLGAGFVPHLDLPFGAKGRQLGNGKVGFGGVIALGYGVDALHVAGNLGLQAVPNLEFLNLNAGARLLTSLSASWAFSETTAACLEATFRPTLIPNERAWTDSPAEVVGSFRHRHESGLDVTAGAAKSLSHGAGAAQFRLFAGVGYRIGKDDRDPDRDGFEGKKDACPEVAEVVNGYLDGDGCPDELGDYALTVLDPNGSPLVGVPVHRGEAMIDRTGQGGVLKIGGIVPETEIAGLMVRPDRGTGMEPAAVPSVVVREPGATASVRLGWLPGAVKVVTRTEEDAIVDAIVSFDGPAERDDETVGDDGEEIFVLEPGDWEIYATSERFGIERRTLFVEPDQRSLVVIEFRLKPAIVVTTREEVTLLQAVQFEFDSDVVKPESIPLLDEVAANLLRYRDIVKRVEVQGHTDDKGPAKYNASLSQRRVESVVAYLLSQGVEPERLVPVGYGEACPLESNATDTGRAANRRVQFIITDPEPDGGIPCHEGVPARVAEPRTLTVEEPAPETP